MIIKDEYIKKVVSLNIAHEMKLAQHMEWHNNDNKVVYDKLVREAPDFEKTMKQVKLLGDKRRTKK